MADSQQAQLLEQLRDIHLPESVSWWPLAPGWWIIIGLLLALAVLFIVRAILQKRHRRFARYALLELGAIQEDEPQDWLMKTHLIMRRASLCYFPKSKVASLDHQQWRQLLESTGRGIWSKKSLQLLQDGLYRPPEVIDSSDKQLFLTEAALWLENLPNIKRVELEADNKKGLQSVEGEQANV